MSSDANFPLSDLAQILQGHADNGMSENEVYVKIPGHGEVLVDHLEVYRDKLVIVGET